MGDRPVWEAPVIAAVAGLVAAVSLWATSTWGPGITSDSTAYIGTTRSLVAGQGAGWWLQDPLTTWPPGYPALVAAVTRRADVSVLGVVRIVGAAAAAATVLFLWLSLRQVVEDQASLTALAAGTGAGAAAVTLAVPALSDGVFLGLVAASVAVVIRSRTRPRLVADPVPLGLLSVALVLTRYVGVGLVAVVAGALWSLGTIGNRAITAASVALVLAAAGGAVWLLRGPRFGGASLGVGVRARPSPCMFLAVLGLLVVVRAVLRFDFEARTLAPLLPAFAVLLGVAMQGLVRRRRAARAIVDGPGVTVTQVR